MNPPVFKDYSLIYLKKRPLFNCYCIKCHSIYFYFNSYLQSLPKFESVHIYCIKCYKQFTVNADRLVYIEKYVMITI